MIKTILAVLGVLMIACGEAFLIMHADTDPHAGAIYRPIVVAGAALILIAIVMYLIGAHKNPPRPDPDTF